MKQYRLTFFKYDKINNKYEIWEEIFNFFLFMLLLKLCDEQPINEWSK